MYQLKKKHVHWYPVHPNDCTCLINQLLFSISTNTPLLHGALSSNFFASTGQGIKLHFQHQSYYTQTLNIANTNRHVFIKISCLKMLVHFISAFQQTVKIIALLIKLMVETISHSIRETTISNPIETFNGMFKSSCSQGWLKLQQMLTSHCFADFTNLNRF
jgi:hypothetical protein